MTNNERKIDARLKKYNQKEYDIMSYVHPRMYEKSGLEGGWGVMLEHGETIFGWNIKDMLSEVDKHFVTD